MKQYNGFKSQYPGALLLFRVGDFYETFGEDAVITSKILGITLTKRHNGSASEIELAGFPHHSLEVYLPKLVRAGQRVAVCDQIEDPRFAKKIVKRGVTELVTPGMSYSDSILETNKNNYLASIAINKNKTLFGISFLDISTGEFFVGEGNQEYVDKLLQSFEPSEVLFSKAQKQFWQEWIGEKMNVYFLEDWFFQYQFGFDTISQHFKTQSLKGFGIDEMEQSIASAGAILHYLSEAQHSQTKHISNIARLDENKYVWLDKFTIRNLELLFPQNHEGVALVDVLDKTITPMGARLLRKWLALPLKDKTKIEERLAIVEIFFQNSDLREEVMQTLKHVGDLERLISKASARRIKPREMVQIKKGLIQIQKLREILIQRNENSLKKMATQLNACDFLLDKLINELKPEPKIVTNEGDLICDNVNEELDELRDIVYNSKKYLDKVLQNAIIETAITSLKIDYNKVYGYYLEVTHAHRSKVPKTWIRKQTLTNAERYITEELKIYEDKILNAEEKINILEQKLFNDLILAVADFTLPIQQNCKVIGGLDCLTNFAQLSEKYKYIKPEIIENNILNIKNGRHAVIEQQLSADETFVPNDVYLDNEKQQVIIITGPNMSGKSALLRQTALIVIMAQIGCYVPAEKAEIGIVDKIFTRVGASDNLAKGESTFMVEMMETASIMNNLSEKSLVLMDEIGRGTSTYDGISIAWAILEYLHNHPKTKPKTLFATHYHELNELTKNFERIKNFHVTVKETGNKIIFLRKLAEGGSEHSFGIHVAQMAGMPKEIVQRSKEVLLQLEELREKQPEKSIKNSLKELPKKQQVHIFETPQDPILERLKTMLKKIDINTLSPIEALMKLNELRNLVK
ncbi:MAG: DNA mismatch repair protein MutS [Bacteroidetes bacterium]|nr:MAG: DNA mismatch repair protein MutS [Bacteroidota bacterium]TAG89547.1 MAG: DNA mismatch repair protein MutS [Bacteroidota bacterium]